MVAVHHPNPKDLARLIESNLEIPTIPVVASRALRAMQDENANAHRLATILQDDPGLTARVLKVANSALYSLPREVKNLAQAAMVLGFEGLKGLVLTAACRGIYKHYGHRERSLWIHSVGAAFAAQQIAKAAGVAADEAFVAGLMHDVGRVVMLNTAREKVDEVEVLVTKESMDVLEAEQKIFGFTHSDVGSLLVSRWALSESLERAVFLHHDLELVDTIAEESKEVVMITHLANRVCHAAGSGLVDPSEEIEPAFEDSAMALQLSEETLEDIKTQTRQRMDESAD